MDDAGLCGPLELEDMISKWWTLIAAVASPPSTTGRGRLGGRCAQQVGSTLETSLLSDLGWAVKMAGRAGAADVVHHLDGWDFPQLVL